MPDFFSNLPTDVHAAAALVVIVLVFLAAGSARIALR